MENKAPPKLGGLLNMVPPCVVLPEFSPKPSQHQQQNEAGLLDPRGVPFREQARMLEPAGKLDLGVGEFRKWRVKQQEVGIDPTTMEVQRYKTKC